MQTVHFFHTVHQMKGTHSASWRAWKVVNWDEARGGREEGHTGKHQYPSSQVPWKVHQ